MKNKFRKKIQGDIHLGLQTKFSQKRQLSVSSSKKLNELSLSFYNDTTLRKNKQFILDSPIQFGYNLCLNRGSSSDNKKAKHSPKKKIGYTIEELPLGKERDQIDFTTTEASKMNLFESVEKPKNIERKPRQGYSESKQKRSMQKYKRQVFIQMLQNRSKMSKGIFDKRQPQISRKN